MTKTIREKLQALVNEIDQECKACECEDCKWETLQAMRIKARIESILATEEQEVRVRKGWVTKDWTGVCWWSDKPHWWQDSPNPLKHFWIHGSSHGRTINLSFVLTDPWEKSHPNGGPDCIMEVG